ncbi:hypothetical protein [Streptomyces sp. NPDC056061]|uniref:hypothetical protein n=1 Tax=Streptomyces sp. NPDC056061 TaxID=3345700 RepID=UPI0035DF9B5E
MSPARRALAGVLAAGALLTATTGCAQSVDPIERLGRKAARNIVHPRPEPAAGPPAHPRTPPGSGGTPGPRSVVACPRPPASRPPSPSPLPAHGHGHGRQDRPGAHAGTGTGPGCDRR